MRALHEHFNGGGRSMSRSFRGGIWGGAIYWMVRAAQELPSGQWWQEPTWALLVCVGVLVSYRALRPDTP